VGGAVFRWRPPGEDYQRGENAEDHWIDHQGDGGQRVEREDADQARPRHLLDDGEVEQRVASQVDRWSGEVAVGPGASGPALASSPAPPPGLTPHHTAVNPGQSPQPLNYAALLRDGASTTLAPGEVKQAIETTADLVGCPECGAVAQLHDRRPCWGRDLPSGGRPVMLVWVKRGALRVSLQRHLNEPARTGSLRLCYLVMHRPSGKLDRACSITRAKIGSDCSTISSVAVRQMRK
jgi:hypothetical protein